MKVKFGSILLLLLVNSISGIAQQDNPDLYDIGGEFAFVRVQYDSYYDGGFYGGPWLTDFQPPMKTSLEVSHDLLTYAS